MTAAQHAAQLYARPRERLTARLRKMLAVYDAGLHGCLHHDIDRVDTAVDVLEATLDYTACPELALALHTLYTRTRQLCQADRFDDAGQILATLRASWIERGRRDKLPVGK